MNEIKKQTFTGSLQEYFTDARAINDLMIAELGDVSGKTILEPAVGEGAFLAGLIDVQRVDAVDINPASIAVVRERFPKRVRPIIGDFISHCLDKDKLEKISLDEQYDAVICNPPYGLKFTTEYRRHLKRCLPNMYVRESYGLFLYLSILKLVNGGRFCFIVPDTFLASHNHKPLRKFLSKCTNVESVYVFNSSRFESVNYGYGSMCIISGNASNVGQVKPCRFVNSRVEGAAIEDGEAREVHPLELTISAEEGWAKFLSAAGNQWDEEVTLGDLAECRTGIYTGDNPRFCSFIGVPPRKVNGHEISADQVFQGELSPMQKENGIAATACYVPLVRGGHWAPFQRQQNFIDWSEEAVKYYREDKKARLQNHRYYFQKGLAVPMVTSGRITASVMESAVFDQGVVGVFPRDSRDLEVLTVLLNSKYATDSKFKVNPSANNSANYLKRIVLPKITEPMREKASELCARWSKKSKIAKNEIEQDAEQLFS